MVFQQFTSPQTTHQFNGLHFKISQSITTSVIATMSNNINQLSHHKITYSQAGRSITISSSQCPFNCYTHHCNTHTSVQPSNIHHSNQNNTSHHLHKTTSPPPTSNCSSPIKPTSASSRWSRKRRDCAMIRSTATSRSTATPLRLRFRSRLGRGACRGAAQAG